jgi:hypothetical protein
MSSTWIKKFEPWFVTAARTCALWNNETDAETLSDYFRTKLRYIDYPLYSQLSQKLATETPCDPNVVSLAHDNSLAISPIHFAYMDVGCWAGDGGENAWTRHREFGVVHGHLAVLCAFSTKPGDYRRYSNPPSWKSFENPTPSPLIDATITRHPDWKPIGNVLGKLSGALRDDKLYILGATAITSRYVTVPARGDTDPVMVFIGDFHAPVATESSNAHIVEAGKELLRGRLDVWTEGIEIPTLLPGAPLVLKTGQFLEEITGDLRWGRSTTRAAMEKWLHCYYVKGRRTADIFQGAGADLRAFVDALADVHRDTWPLEVFQLGDLFDLWLGFQRAFGRQEGTLKAVDNLLEDALEFARFWVERSLFQTDQGPHLVHLLTLSARAGKNRQTGAALRTHFLYGNHDNYRKHGGGMAITVPEGHEHAGMKIAAFHVPSFSNPDGLWAEHGHQPDPNNRDENPAKGHRATQLAFFTPSIRSAEGAYGWAASTIENDNLLRVTSIHHAIDTCLLRHLDKTAPEPCRGFYVMGHSHEPMLKRVELWPSPPRKGQ